MLDYTRFEAYGGSGRDIEPMTVGGGAIEVQRGVGLREVHVATDLHRTVAGVHDVHRESRRAWIDDDIAVAVDDFPGDHGIGWWTVTSLVPSGNVASTCTSCSI